MTNKLELNWAGKHDGYAAICVTTATHWAREKLISRAEVEALKTKRAEAA